VENPQITAEMGEGKTQNPALHPNDQKPDHYSSAPPWQRTNADILAASAYTPPQG
jgi:hypothetical protein